jgi:2-succinyl-5-enolpyruvyl-6-hydroxy-3-cyclohexene-1-carboxylate synthase
VSDTPGRGNLTVSAAFVDELSRHGLHHVVVAPGSRSTPLAVAAATHPRLRVWMHVDERSAGFFALGMARALGEPVAVLCTSGTAAANFLPAVVEAQFSRVPLIVLTADRPPELRGWGAAQTIDQVHLYGGHAKWFAEMPVPEESPSLLRQARAAAARALATSAEAPQGPVHLNLPFREPLLPVDLDPQDLGGALYAELERPEEPGLASAAPTPVATTVGSLAERLSGFERGIIVCGPGETPGLAAATAALGEVAGYPILADPLSGVRFGNHHHLRIIDAYDAFLRDLEAAQGLAPDVVLRVGGWPTSKPLQTFLTANPGRLHVLVDPGEPRDPAHLATDHLRADPHRTLAMLADRLAAAGTATTTRWTSAWTTASDRTRRAIARTLAENETLFEGRAAAELAALLPDGATLVAGNSMPVRDVDTFVAGDRRRIRVVGNRGASGIDGVVSTALGAAAVADGPVILLVGDLSFYHDMNGLLAAKLHDIDCTIVLLNNDGGGIFSFLPQAELLERGLFEWLFGTPTGLDFEHAAALYGASFARPADWPSFRRAVCQGIATPGLSIVEVVTDRERNVAMHREVWDAVREALR